MSWLWAVALAAAEPDVPAPGGDTIVHPVSLGAFRAAFPAGTTFRYRMEAAGRPTTVVQWRFTAVDVAGGTREVTIYAEDGTTLLEAVGPQRDEWAELLSHATFPRVGTLVEDSRVEVPGGAFDTTLYTVSAMVDGAPTVERFHFAKRLPGPPVQYTTEVAGQVVASMTLLERSVKLDGIVLAEAPEASALAARVAARAGDPYAEKGLRFTFGVGTMTRTHAWDIQGGRVEVRWSDEAGRACRATVPVPYTGTSELEQTAWAMFVNDQFWLLAPAKVLDPGVVRTADGADLRLFYAGVGLTPGDRYLLHTTPEGDVSGWEYVLQSGRGAAWTWSAPVRVGGLRLSLERTSGDRILRFTDVAVGKQKLDPAPAACATPGG